MHDQHTKTEQRQAVRHKEEGNNLENGFNIRDYLDVNNMTESEIDRCEFWVTANRIVRESGQHNFQHEKIEVNTNWDLGKLEEWLTDYHDNKVVSFLKYGWPLNTVDTEIDEQIPNNQKGAQQNAEQVQEYLDSELKNGSIIGPFVKNPFGKFARFSPLGHQAKEGLG